MRKSIWKYQLMSRTTSLRIPKGAQFLHADTQREQFCLWFLVDTEAPEETRTFTVYNKGHPIKDDPGTFLGTALMAGGDLVFHAFEEKT